MKSILFVVFLTYLWIVYCDHDEGFHKKDDGNHLNSYFAYDSGFLIVATLDGSLIAVDKNTGDIKWSLKNEPAVKVFVKHKTPHTSPVFLPDPKDGSLYLFNVKESRGLTKLPFSIQQLVNDSPTRSKDGIFYFGRKHDSWISIDNITGEKNVLRSTEEFEKVCPIQSPNVFFVGRTEYNLALIDSKRKNNNWNITYFDYSSRTLTTDQLNKYGYIHISASASGRVRTIDRKTGLIQWEKDFGSPMVSLYLEWGKDIFNLPFTSAGDLSLEALSSTLNSDKLRSTLFIGEHSFGYYALPAVIDSKVSILSDTVYTSRFLLGGPDGEQSIAPLVLGHYSIPTTPKIPLRIAGKHKTNQIIYTDILNTTENSISASEQKAEIYISPESKIIAAVIAVFAISVIGMFVYIIRQVREIKQSSQGSNVALSGNICSYDNQKGIVTIGKITFDTKVILGRGCAGTSVYRGTFDGRDVAVKRLLPENFTIADREVRLLRETDSHPNVIRYFSTEQDTQFRYIALELCTATLEDYVERGSYKEDISFVDVLKQATLGVEHLHSLKIVHRDIKPNNILLAKGNHNKIKVMISDFGLCKKMANDRNSFSKSGVTGTVGWIAPEMMASSGRVMPAVDIFSLGCVFYYTIVGKHPFGELLTRQSNIVSGLSKLHLNDKLWTSLISQMIHSDPLKRPTVFVVKSHPVFWKKSFILSFLLDVSDRVDKENYHSSILFQLEEGGESVYFDGWIKLIDAEVSEDLGKYRTYREDSVRDLLRAFRNKRHHYLELSQTTQQILGATAESYVNYWFSRFPVLLYHVWSSLQLLHDEPLFNQYYNMSYMFPCDKSDFVPKWLDDMKHIEGSRNNKKQKTSVQKYKTKYKSHNSFNNMVNNGVAKDCWIKEGERTGAWRPKQ